MAQKTSDLWKSLLMQKGTRREYLFVINGEEFGPDKLVEHDSEKSLFLDFGFGNAAIGSLNLKVYAEDIPHGAEIKRFVRLVKSDGSIASEYIPKGVFWANRRPEDDGLWSIEAFDGMRKAEKAWEPDQTLEFPMPMPDAVEEIAGLMGVEIDHRTISLINSEYTIDYPTSNQTYRQTLAWIAAAHGGNFIMSDEGKLLLVPLLSAPQKTNYLVDEYGRAITLGGVRILV